MIQDILIVDDEADIRELIAGLLEDEGYHTRVAGESDSALSLIESRKPSLVVLDIWLQGSRLDGLELLDFIKEEHPGIPVIMISGHGNIETAVSAVKRGADNFIEKPFKSDHLLHLVEIATENARLRRENEDLKARMVHNNEIIGNSPAINAVRQMAERTAQTNSRVMITGPVGTGKEVVARYIHGLSTRQKGPFIVVNAANIAPERMEIELFGVERKQQGAAGGRKIGLFEKAHGGTLLIDEIADMPMETQNKILRVLVDQTFERVDGTTKVEVNVRVMSASSRNLLAAIEEKTFREDLYHRLNVVPIHMPPLKERREDIIALTEHFMDRVAHTSGMPRREVGEDILAALQGYDWPGNVRQLRNVVERLLILATEDALEEINAEMLPDEINSAGNATLSQVGDTNIMSVPLRQARESFEVEYLRAQIARFGGNISKTAVFIGMERSALHRKLKTLGLQATERQSDAEQE
jgi:two-component system, NtrC family, nitrogen regulation response regulator NtrX